MIPLVNKLPIATITHINFKAVKWSLVASDMVVDNLMLGQAEQAQALSCSKNDIYITVP